MKAEQSQMIIAQDISSINRQKQQQFPLKKIAHHWHLYVSHHAPSILDINKTLHKLVYICYSLCKKQYFESLFDINEIPQQFYEININYSKILTTILSYAKQQDDIARIIHQLLQNFGYEPTTFLQALSIILHYYLENILNKKNKMVIVMITSFPISDINQIRAHMVDNFISLEVVVLKVYSIKLMPVSIQFVCFDCKGVFTHLLENGNYSIPIRCLSSIKKHCNGRLFTAKKQSVTTIFMQRIKVQEQDPQGRVPRQIVCQLRNNLVSKLITGQTIKLSGIIKTQSIDEKDKKTHGIFTPYIIVNSLQQKISGVQKNYDMQCIHKMQQNKNIFYSIIKSFCPTIYGHDIVKAGLVLGIVGGSNKYLNDESIFRQTSHVLLLGDPGIGKSQMLKFAVQMLSHSIYVNATGVSHSGLTVTINKQNNQQSLEAGALILADNGICAIDEFDKATDLSSLLEVMEQQTVSIAKAGIICQLKCRVGIIASANPIHGCYNSTKSFRQNTKISNAILSRFDLIFLLVDKPDPARDKKLSQHIMKIHNQKRKKHYQQKYEEIESRQGVTSQYANYLSLNDKYSKIVESVQTVYNIEELKKYMNYVRNQIHPMLTIQASQIIKGFYIALRQNNPDNSFQITNRQLQSLVRLAMARARLECRNKVTQNDALEITQLMQESLFDSFEQMGYNINALRNQSKKAKIFKKNGELSMPKQRNLYIDALQEQTNIRSSTIWQWTELVQLAKQLELNIGDFYNFIERLNQDGILLQKGNKRYSLQKVYL